MPIVDQECNEGNPAANCQESFSGAQRELANWLDRVGVGGDEPVTSEGDDGEPHESEPLGTYVTSAFDVLSAMPVELQTDAVVGSQAQPAGNGAKPLSTPQGDLPQDLFGTRSGNSRGIDSVEQLCAIRPRSRRPSNANQNRD